MSSYYTSRRYDEGPVNGGYGQSDTAGYREFHPRYQKYRTTRKTEDSLTQSYR